MKIRIVKWEKLNARKDVNNPSWFKFKHKFFNDPDFRKFTNGEKLFWIYLLCEASCHNSAGFCQLSTKHSQESANFSQKEIRSALRKLSKLKMIEIETSRGRTEFGTSAGVRQEEKRREEKTEEEIRKETNLKFLNFDLKRSEIGEGDIEGRRALLRSQAEVLRRQEKEFA